MNKPLTERYGRSYMLEVELPRAKARNKAMLNAITALDNSRGINVPTDQNKSTEQH